MKIFYQLRNKIRARRIVKILEHYKDQCVLLKNRDFFDIDRQLKYNYLAIPISPLSETKRNNGKTFRTYMAIGLFIQNVYYPGRTGITILFVCNPVTRHDFRRWALPLYKQMGLNIEKSNYDSVWIEYNDKRFVIKMLSRSQFYEPFQYHSQGLNTVVFFDHFEQTVEDVLYG